MGNNKESAEPEFVPIGAITFMVTILLVYAGIWFSIFALMAARG